MPKTEEEIKSKIEELYYIWDLAFIKLQQENLAEEVKNVLTSRCKDVMIQVRLLKWVLGYNHVGKTLRYDLNSKSWR